MINLKAFIKKYDDARLIVKEAEAKAALIYNTYRNDKEVIVYIDNVLNQYIQAQIDVDRQYYLNCYLNCYERIYAYRQMSIAGGNDEYFIVYFREEDNDGCSYECHIDIPYDSNLVSKYVKRWKDQAIAAIKRHHELENIQKEQHEKKLLQDLLKKYPDVNVYDKKLQI